MKDNKSIEAFTNKLKKVWKKSPNLRFSHLLYMLEDNFEDKNNEMYFQSDEAWEKALNKLSEKVLDRHDMYPPPLRLQNWKLKLEYILIGVHE